MRRNFNMFKLVGKISNLKYKSYLKSPLSTVSIHTDVNQWPQKCCVKDNSIVYAVSKWKGPKRTRTYPFANVYDTLSSCGGKTVTIIPIVKDEGADSQNMDYLQWDTIQLMSLLNVYVILAYYIDAEPNLRDAQKPNRITNQKLDSGLVKAQIEELSHHHSSALHWNLARLDPDYLNDLMQKVIDSYQAISIKTGLKLHNARGLERFKQRIIKNRESFLAFSRAKSAQAQRREIATTQPKESLSTGVKTPIEIENYLGGKYFLTVDDLIIRDNTYELVESKHSRREMLPGENDIKDGLIKMLLFSNIDELHREEGDKSRIPVNFTPVLRLTSEKLFNRITSNADENELQSFSKTNSFKPQEKELIRILFKEAKTNNFKVIIEHSKIKTL